MLIPMASGTETPSKVALGAEHDQARRPTFLGFSWEIPTRPSTSRLSGPRRSCAGTRGGSPRVSAVAGVSVDLAAPHGGQCRYRIGLDMPSVARDRISGRQPPADRERGMRPTCRASRRRAATPGPGDPDHAAARNRRDFVKAQTRARTAVTMIRSRIRIAGCAELEFYPVSPSLGGSYADRKGGDNTAAVQRGAGRRAHAVHSECIEPRQARRDCSSASAVLR